MTGATTEPLSKGAPDDSDWPGVRDWLRAPGQVQRATRDPETWLLFLRKPGGSIGAALFVLLLAGALLASWIFPGDPGRSVGTPLLWPGQDPAFPLGTDSLGRDVAAMLAHGARTSLGVGASAAAIGLAVGTLLGALAGYFGGWVDGLVTRVTELFQATPNFLFVVVVVALFQPTETVVALAIGLTTWEAIARLVRAEFRQLLQSDFVLAARSAGYGNARIIVREILPNVLPSIVVMASFRVANAIFMESGLAFLGLGDPGAVSWGAMINEGRDFIRSCWFLTMVPTAAIVGTVLTLNLIGDALNDILNPRLRRNA